MCLGSKKVTFQLPQMTFPERRDDSNPETRLKSLQQALKLIDMTATLESSLQEPLIYCDIKPQHFGVDSRGNLKIIDSGDLLFKSVAGEQGTSVFILIVH